MAMMRSLYRSICFRSLCSSSAAVNHRQHLPQGLRYFHLSPSSASSLSIFFQNHPFRSKSRECQRAKRVSENGDDEVVVSLDLLQISLFLFRRRQPPSTPPTRPPLFPSLPSSSSFPFSSKTIPSDCLPPFTMAIGSIRFFSEDVTHFPDIKDPEILFVFKDLMAASWDELPDTLISDANKALSKNTDDKAAQEAVANVFRAAEAVEEFSGMLVSLRMAIDDSTGLGGEDVKPLPEEFVNALRTVYQRYTAYLDAFGPDETYLRKKVETELGTKMIHLKMRCSGIGSEWGKVTVLGTSGLSGSYVEHRA
ncbi:hypothetical protein HYC85_000588 [Camellia sinensis]|uniref:Succinate dehydrogenase subunit 5, mitochondrial n=2 Tax=Magnoliopsida TaxID=3398 RepID=A0A7J7I366_CAMSI|nr:hypothetical protein HYC85_000588 [Camellia sinensis]